MTTESTVLDFEQMFNDYVKSIQKIWDHDRSKSLGASETFSCLRQTYFKKQGEEKPFDAAKAPYGKDVDYEDTWGAMQRGNVMEDHWVVPALRATLPGKKVNFEFSGDDQVTFVYGKNSATPDGLYTGLSRDALSLYGIPDIGSDCVLIEMKSIDPRAGLDEEKAVHHGQAQVQMGILRSMTEHKPLYTVILYVDASFYDQISVFVVKFDETAWRSAKIRAKLIFEAKDPSKLSAEGKLTDACKLCAFTRACARVSKENVPTKDNANALSEEERTVLFAKAAEERKLAAEIKELLEYQKDVRGEIKELLTGANTKKAKDDRFSISWVWQAGRVTYNTKAAIAAGVDLSNYASEGAGFEKMIISVTGDENNDE